MSTDPYECLQISLNPDGTLKRTPHPSPIIPAAPQSTIPTAVLSKDIPINHQNKTWARVFLPQQHLVNPNKLKLPLLVYFNGGGFIMCSPDLTMFHQFCSNIASQLGLVVVSVNYRLAPEHRLPAAYDDGMEALQWIKASEDDWVRDHGDLSRCLLMGTSAGGNLVYNLGLRAAQEIDNLLPLNIKGLILHQPFFGGVQRTESELRLVNDPIFPPCVSDLMWELALPVGVDRDHKYCNPTVDDRFTKIKGLGWKVLVTGCDGDQLIDRQMELVKMMEKSGIQVMGRFTVGDFHGYEIIDSSKAKALHVVLENFIMSLM